MPIQMVTMKMKMKMILPINMVDIFCFFNICITQCLKLNTKAMKKCECDCVVKH